MIEPGTWVYFTIIYPTHFPIIRSYLTGRTYKMNYNGLCLPFSFKSTGILQGSIFGPVLYKVYTSDIPINPNNIITTYSDYTCLLSFNNDAFVASQYLQFHLSSFLSSSYFKCQNWNCKAHSNKSNQIIFTFRRKLNL